MFLYLQPCLCSPMRGRGVFHKLGRPRGTRPSTLPGNQAECQVGKSASNSSLALFRLSFLSFFFRKRTTLQWRLCWNQTLTRCFLFCRIMVLLANGAFAAKFQRNHLSLAILPHDEANPTHRFALLVIQSWFCMIFLIGMCLLRVLSSVKYLPHCSTFLGTRWFAMLDAWWIAVIVAMYDHPRSCTYIYIYNHIYIYTHKDNTSLFFLWKIMRVDSCIKPLFFTATILHYWQYRLKVSFLEDFAVPQFPCGSRLDGTSTHFSLRVKHNTPWPQRRGLFG